MHCYVCVTIIITTVLIYVYVCLWNNVSSNDNSMYVCNLKTTNISNRNSIMKEKRKKEIWKEIAVIT